MTRTVFFIGIKGVGMTALALAMQEDGWVVSGSDTGESFITDAVLAARGITVLSPIDTPIPAGTDKIIYSGAYVPPAGGIPLAEALAEFVKGRKVIAVAGVGGKTTTTAMLAVLFPHAGRDVGYYVGTGSIVGLSGPGSAGTDPYFVVEADEYVVSKTDHRPKFALLHPEILITTNIVFDHPDVYTDESATLRAFTELVKSIPAGGTWICNPTDPLTKQILDLQCQTLQDTRLASASDSESRRVKVILYGSDHPLYSELNLAVFGEQNKLDGLAAVLAAEAAGLTEAQALEAITAYHGAGRRQEFHGEVEGRLLYDDYGHHPQEIALTIKSFKEHFPGKKILVVFESHTYSRTESLLTEFAKALALADQVFIMPIFESAREKGQGHTVTPSSFAAMIPGAVAVTWDNAHEIVWNASRDGDVILTMGAGFVYKLHEEFKLH